MIPLTPDTLREIVQSKDVDADWYDILPRQKSIWGRYGSRLKEVFFDGSQFMLIQCEEGIMVFNCSFEPSVGYCGIHRQ